MGAAAACNLAAAASRNGRGAEGAIATAAVDRGARFVARPSVLEDAAAIAAVAPKANQYERSPARDGWEGIFGGCGERNRV